MTKTLSPIGCTYFTDIILSSYIAIPVTRKFRHWERKGTRGLRRIDWKHSAPGANRMNNHSRIIQILYIGGVILKRLCVCSVYRPQKIGWPRKSHTRYATKPYYPKDIVNVCFPWLPNTVGTATEGYRCRIFPYLSICGWRKKKKYIYTLMAILPYLRV